MKMLKITTIFLTFVFFINSAYAHQRSKLTSLDHPVASEAIQLEKIKLNEASITDFLKIKGLNKSKARAIISFRKKNGEFKSLDQLSQVSGFKKMSQDKLQAILNQLSL